MRKCVFCKTRYNKESKMSFHRFPSEWSLRNRWLENMKAVNWTPKKEDALCSKHFDTKCIITHNTRTALKCGTVPTLFEGLFEYPSTPGISNTDLLKIIRRDHDYESSPTPNRTTIPYSVTHYHHHRNHKQVSGNRAPEKTEPQGDVFIQVKVECNEEQDPLTLEPISEFCKPNVKIEPVDIKQEIDEDIDEGPSGNYIVEPLKNEYDNYIEINENERLLALEPNVKIEPVDIKQEIDEDIEEGPSGNYIEEPLINEYDHYIEINENELIPNVKVKEEDD